MCVCNRYGVYVLCVCVLDYFQLKVFKVQSFWIYFEEIICDFKCLTSKFISVVCVVGLLEWISKRENKTSFLALSLKSNFGILNIH